MIMVTCGLVTHLMYWRLETPYMLHWHIVILTEAGLQIFIEGGKDLAVENLSVTS